MMKSAGDRIAADFKNLTVMIGGPSFLVTSQGFVEGTTSDGSEPRRRGSGGQYVGSICHVAATLQVFVGCEGHGEWTKTEIST